VDRCKSLACSSGGCPEKAEFGPFHSVRYIKAMSWMLQYCFLIALMTPALAGQDARNALPEGNDSCQMVSVSDSGEQGSESTPPNESCDSPDGEVPDDARQEIASEIAEGTQTSVSLESLLLGRNYVFFGRIEIEAAAYFGDIPSSENGAELRRLRLGIAGLSTFFDSVSYKFELDLTDGTNNFCDLYLQWDLRSRGFFRLGNQRVSQNLSAMTSSLSQLFMEEPLPVSTFSLKRRLALSYDANWRRFGLHGMVFTRDPNNDAGKYGWALRAFTKPVRGPRSVGHVGISLVSEKMDREARYLTAPESRITGTRLVDTGLYSDVRYQHVAGIELAGGVGSNSARLELFRSRWDREGGQENTFNGAYLELGHFLTGQAFNYKGGKFVRPVLEPGARAWELGFRASWVDLSDKDVRGGEQVNLGAALNYYIRPDLRFQLNLLRFRTDAVAGDEAGWIMQGRLQYNR
jgi:phosphate-selective porin OprO/OprP